MSNLRTRAWLGDLELTEHFRVVDVVRPYPIRSATVDKAPGTRGGIITSSVYEPIEISMKLVSVHPDREERRERMRWLMGILDFDEPRPLQFSDDNGRYYKVIPSGGGERSATFRSDSVEVTFTAPDPIMYGRHMTYDMVSDSAQGVTESVLIDGTASTLPLIDANFISGSSPDYTWGIVAGDHVMRFDVLYSATGFALSVDCEEQTARLNASPVTPIIGTEWLVLDPGEINITIEGPGEVHFEWDERWL